MAQESTISFKLNLPKSLRDRLGEAAERSGRSLTAEINTRLEKSFEADEEMANVTENIDDLMLRVERLEETVRSHDQRMNPDRYDWEHG